MMQLETLLRSTRTCQSWYGSSSDGSLLQIWPTVPIYKATEKTENTSSVASTWVY